jgi:uncharacterized protein YecE (DUF72 family)
MSEAIIAEGPACASHGRIAGVAGTLYLGTSGFAYDEWKGPFYPNDLKQKEMLPFYATRFGSVEVNYTFRRQPAEKTLATWREATPEGFLITLKAHQRITHWLRLADADEAVGSFLERAKLLGPRLGTILFQCPPNLPFDRGLIENFLGFLPPIYRYAFEFRHPSWTQAREILADQGAAWCLAETGEKSAPDEPISAEPFAYLRLRKEDYSDDELEVWAKRIAQALDEERDVFCYFKHEEKGAGPVFAERLAAIVATPGA